MIAAGLRDSLTVELQLPGGLTGHEGPLLNAVDAIRSLAQIAVPRRHVEVVRGSRPSCWGERQVADGSRLIHTPETWCSDRLAVRRRSWPRCLPADAEARHEATRTGRTCAVEAICGTRSTAGVAASRCKARMPCSSSTMGWAVSCRCPKRTCRAIRCRSTAGMIRAPSSPTAMAAGVCVVRDGPCPVSPLAECRG